MKKIDKKKFNEALSKAHVTLGLTYTGEDNKMKVGCLWDNRPVGINELSDERLMILFQLVNNIAETLMIEQASRGLLPENIADMLSIKNKT